MATSEVITLGGALVLSIQLDVPRVGVWTANAQVDATEPLNGAVDLVLGGRTWRGTVVSGGDVADRVTVRVVGGHGGLGGAVPARCYANVPVRVPLEDALGAVGERLSATSDPSVTELVLPYWVGRASTCGEALAALLSVAGGPSWRMLPTGELWIGSETWTALEPEGVTTKTADDPVAGVREYSFEDLSVLPGQTFEGYRISHVTIRGQGGAVRAEVWAEQPRDAGSSLLESLMAIVRTHVTSRTAYLRWYPATVEEQVGDTVSATPDDQTMPPVSGAKLLGMPGVEVEVEPGARCCIGFLDGDPSKPFACNFQPESLRTLTITATGKVVINSSDIQLGDGAGLDIARVGDAIMIQIPPPIGIPVMGQILSGSRNARSS